MMIPNISLENFKKGCEEEWRIIYDAYTVPLETYVVSMTEDRVFSKDLVQDAFLKLWLKKESINDPKGIHGFLKAIVKNNTVDYYRNKERLEKIKSHLQNTLYDLESENYKPFVINPQDFIKAFSRLGKIYQDVLKLHLFEGKSNKEISAMLKIPAGTIKNRKTEGYRQLVHALKATL